VFQSPSAGRDELLGALSIDLSPLLPAGGFSRRGLRCVGRFFALIAVGACQSLEIAKFDAIESLVACLETMMTDCVPQLSRRVKVVIGKPIKTEGMTFEQRDTLTSQLHSEVCRLKGLWERGVGAESFEGAPESFLNCWRPMPKVPPPHPLLLSPRILAFCVDLGACPALFGLNSTLLSVH
jgi:hypothetical protein